jgi:uncharacterized protein
MGRQMLMIETSDLNVKLKPTPIEPSWIIEGNPVAQGSVLSRSADGLASTVLWECTEGKFHWYYDYDETIMVLEGSMILENDAMRPTRYGPGDIILFRNGAHARWHVQGRVRKLAFCRTTQPYLLSFAMRVFNKIKRTLLPSVKAQSASLAGSA